MKILVEMAVNVILGEINKCLHSSLEIIKPIFSEKNFIFEYFTLSSVKNERNAVDRVREFFLSLI